VGGLVGKDATREPEGEMAPVVIGAGRR